MAFNVIEASKKITEKYKRYLKTIFDIDNPEYKSLFIKALDGDEPFAKGPYLDVTDSFEKGSPVSKLIDEGILSKDFSYIENIYVKTLHWHQEEALRKSLKNKNLVVSTGTGSGKTESFLLPILNALMREKEEKGKLCPGVRALIIYPMNALANDQIDRLRGLLRNYPDITFGCYTGQTEHSDEKAELQFKKLNRDEETGEEAQHLPNELLSRDAMKRTPPHILITHYAMLEYLMLRPADNVFFDGPYAKYWKYIVLDEAHTYTGSTGIELSMLLRRVLAKLNNPSVQYILTSATLGDKDSNKEVVQFAESLCNAPFYEEDIIRAKRIDLLALRKSLNIRLTSDFYGFTSRLIDDGYEDKYVLEKIEQRFDLDVSNCDDLSSFLYDLLLRDETYWAVKGYLSSPKSVFDICQYMNWTSAELSDFVEVASRANKNRMKLFDARYHLFIRATEGVFITLHPHKEVFLSRKNKHYFEGTEYKAFEVVSCTQCHSLYILGNIETIESKKYLAQKSNINPLEIKEAFWIGAGIRDEDEDETLETQNLKVDEYELCPYCGFIRATNAVHKDACEHSPSEYIKITKVKTSEITGRVTKCVACESVNRLGILRGFFTGQEASTSVIGTALFEELPSHEKKIVIHNSETDGFDDGFGDEMDVQIIESIKAKQFIAFSDSRQAAAYFASYFSETYDGFLYSKVLRDALVSMDVDKKAIPSFVKEISSVFAKNGIAPFGDRNPDYMTEAWKAVLKELVDNRTRHSLIGLGLLNIEPLNCDAFSKNDKYNLSKEDVQNICMVFIMSMLSDAAIYYNKEIDEESKEFFTHNGVETTYLLNVSNAFGIRSFVPKTENRTNKRLEYFTRVLKTKGITLPREELIKLMEAFWKRFFEKQDLVKNVTTKNGLTGFRVNTENLVVSKTGHWYRCSRCKRLTTYNVANVCPSYMCDGVLESVNVDEQEKDNHYYRMYNDLSVQPLRVVEHTAQLNREEAYNYQNLFKKKKIDVLSCSTTFEMGVDVGELETVFMRNMPPSPSNYAQRAGRAGRSTQSAAFALTFCNKSNHDFNFFKEPVSMINGLIKPPSFKTDNEKICIRHVYSSALAFFWRKNSQFFNTAEDMMEKGGYEKFKEYLESKPQDLKEYVLRSLPSRIISAFGIEEYLWVEWLFDKPKETCPNLTRVYELYDEEISALLKEKQNLFDRGNSVDYVTMRIANYRKEKIITFLSKNGILPKYGFPVDTVELSVTNRKSLAAGLDLSRDLSMAIAEYAPGCQVVANGKLITSRYIRKVPNEHWKMYDYVKCSGCQTLNLSIHTENKENDNLLACKQCGKPFTSASKRTFLIPDFGFIAESKIEKPTLVKPERTYRTEADFVNYNNDIPEKKYQINDTDVYISMVDGGPMAMLTTDDFFVCQSCGYAEDSSQTTSAYFKETIKEHKTPSGKTCANKKLNKYFLGYRFETDVVRIRIEKHLDYNAAYSVLQSLILAASDELNIDSNEIAGCLQYYNTGLYNFILYDTTPGGAGHVKRLNNEILLQKIFATAYNKAKNCTCGGEEADTSCYSCLRTYQNQRNHDIIKRKYVIEYLGDLVGEKY